MQLRGKGFRHGGLKRADVSPEVQYEFAYITKSPMSITAFCVLLFLILTITQPSHLNVGVIIM